jgi:hypothetical protein
MILLSIILQILSPREIHALRLHDRVTAMPLSCPLQRRKIPQSVFLREMSVLLNRCPFF